MGTGPSLRRILLSYGIPARIVKAIGNIYDNSRCRVWTEDGLSDWCRQGCILSPILFAVAIDWVLKKATKDHGIVWTGGAKLFDLDFADDIAALSDSTQGLQTVMDSISDASARLGLMISRKKTKIMLSDQVITRQHLTSSLGKIKLM